MAPRMASSHRGHLAALWALLGLGLAWAFLIAVLLSGVAFVVALRLPVLKPRERPMAREPVEESSRALPASDEKVSRMAARDGQKVEGPRGTLAPP